MGQVDFRSRVGLGGMFFGTTTTLDFGRLGAGPLSLCSSFLRKSLMTREAYSLPGWSTEGEVLRFRRIRRVSGTGSTGAGGTGDRSCLPCRTRREFGDSAHLLV